MTLTETQQGYVDKAAEAMREALLNLSYFSADARGSKVVDVADVERAERMIRETVMESTEVTVETQLDGSVKLKFAKPLTKGKNGALWVLWNRIATTLHTTDLEAAS